MSLQSRETTSPNCNSKPPSLDVASPEFLPIFMKPGKSKFFSTSPLILTPTQQCLIPLLHSTIKLTACCLSDVSLVKAYQIGMGTGAQHMQGETESWVCSALRGSTEETA